MTPPTLAIELEELFRPAQAGQGDQTRDDTQEDPGKDMWTTYMNEVKEDDIRDAAAWREDANGILVFTGLFAATVGAFIIEFYKKLSPDSGDQTVDLLKQISRQLAGSSNGTDTNTENQSPSSETLIIWVMAMWLTSLVLSITSALVATLLQQWARRYTEMPKMPGKAFHRARVRSFMFYGTQLYKMSVAVQMPSALLHLSVFFFFGGLVALFHSVNKKVAIAVYVSVGLFAVAYITLTILPCLDHRCPYRTPMSYILWYPWHALLSLVAVCGCFFIGQVDDFMATPTSDDGPSSTLSWLVQYLGEDVKKHKQRLKDGFAKSIIQKAIKAPVDLDRMALTWLFKILALADKSKLSKFVASIPRDKVIELVTPLFDSGKIVFREPFLKLLQSCAGGPRAVETISVNIQSQPQTPEFKTPPTGMYRSSRRMCSSAAACRTYTLFITSPRRLSSPVLMRRGRSRYWMTYGPNSQISV
ncbi:hypothetical protein BC827DRAFT_786206 [Russula dissimulans]|nr:hypothetical protein BC827DRAFT_786206 [Russula dissimulans]